VEQERVFRKVAWRLIPFMIILYIVSFLDRVNVGFAALTMNTELGFSKEVFGIGGGMFFVAYFFFEVPSNVLMEKVGARLWICRIMLTWGLVSGAMAFITDVTGFYTLRFLLGVAEAGFFPGMIFYLSYWFPTVMRARYVATFMMAIPIANIVGSPISGALLGLDGWHGLAGWQWLFLLEAAPALILAGVVLKYLPNGPQNASWLSEEEKAVIADAMRSEPPVDHAGFLPAMSDLRVWLLGFSAFGVVVGLYGCVLWLPQVVKAMGYTNFETGVVVAVPYIAGAIAMVLWGRSSDKYGERKWHAALAAGLGGMGLIWAAMSSSNYVTLFALTLATIGIYASLGPFWGLPIKFLRGTALAAGVAWINSVSNVGGFVGPYAMGKLSDMTGNFTLGMYVLGTGCLVTAVLIVALGPFLKSRTQQQEVTV
jgi:ACS family tartrate transporter-like MFS transporter